MTHSLKIIYLTSVMPYGLGEEFIIEEIREFLQLGHHITIIPRSPDLTYNGSTAREMSAISIALPLLTVRMIWLFIGELLKQPTNFYRITILLLKSRNYLTLIKNLAIFPKAVWVSRFALRHKIDHIHAHWALTTSTIAMIASHLTGIPWSFTAHRADIAGDNLLRQKIMNAYFVRFISISGFEMAKSICKGSFNRNAHIIHMGVRVPSSHHASDVLMEPQIIFCPANLLPVKGHIYLLEAVSILLKKKINCVLHIAGQGYLLNSLMLRVQELGIASNVLFLGQISHDLIMDLYQERKIRMVVLPSIQLSKNEHEGIPVSLMEAMSFRIPCISTTTGGIPELLGEGAGILVCPEDPTALANAIEVILCNNQLCKQIEDNGYKRIEAEFNVSKSVKHLVSLISSNSANNG